MFSWNSEVSQIFPEYLMALISCSIYIWTAMSTGSFIGLYLTFPTLVTYKILLKYKPW